MPDVVVAPYAPVSKLTKVGDWALLPFSRIDDAANLPAELDTPVRRLVDAYAVSSGGGRVVGALAYPLGANIGDEIDRSKMEPLRRAVLAGAIANNPRMALEDEDQDPNAGYSGATAENALLWGHPVTDGNSYVLQLGVLYQVLAYTSAPAEEPLPPIAPPRELPESLFVSFDAAIADATYRTVTSGSEAGRRLFRALDWYLVAFSNAESVTLDVRIGAARSAIESMTGAGDQTKAVVRAFGRLLDETGAATEQREIRPWKGPVALTANEWWMARLSDLRNAIVHGDEIAGELWTHEGHHHLNFVHDKLIEALLAFVASEASRPSLRLRLPDRGMAELAEEAFRALQPDDGAP